MASRRRQCPRPTLQGSAQTAAPSLRPDMHMQLPQPTLPPALMLTHCSSFLPSIGCCMAYPMSLSLWKGLQQEPGAVADHRHVCMFDCLVCRLSIVGRMPTMPKRRPSPRADWKRASCAASMVAWKRARFTALASTAAAAVAARCLLASSCSLHSSRLDLAFANFIQRHDVQGRDMCRQCWQTKVC